MCIRDRAFSQPTSCSPYGSGISGRMAARDVSRGVVSTLMRLRAGTVRAYLQALRDAATVPGATEYTLRPPLVDFLHAAALDLERAPITVHPELRLRDVGHPDLPV